LRVKLSSNIAAKLSESCIVAAVAVAFIGYTQE
jgi:hypothetical protein